jgi:arsenate reductase
MKYGDSFVAESAGYLKKDINPLAVEVMKEYGVDISNHSVDRLIDMYSDGKSYQYVITVCNKERENDCPIFPGLVSRFHWNDFENPEDFTGTHEDKLKNARKLRDDIEKRIDEFVKLVNN